MVAAAVACALSASQPALASDHSLDYERAYAIGLEAYVYGLPLLTTNQTFLSMTSTNVSQGAFGPANQFNSVRGTNTASSTAVVAPGATGLSSIAWLDLSEGPQVVHVPEVTGHSFVLAFIDPYTTNLVNLGSASKTPPGFYVVRDPAQREIAVPPGTTAIDVDYSRIWVIGSTQLKGPADIPAVNAIQDGYTVTSLADFTAGITASPPATPQPAITDYPLPDGLAYFDALGQLLQEFPPPQRDAPILRRMASVGIGPGLSPSTDDQLASQALQGLADAVADGPAAVQKQVKALYATDFGRHDGYLLGGFGRYGTDYAKRAVISQVGLGAFMSTQAMYAMAWSDAGKEPLSGSSRYVLHLPKAPPTHEGWSLTVYSLQGTLIANAADRYAFTSSSPLHRNADGSIDIYVQAHQPRQAARQRNWLPVAAGQGFEVTWRLFAPRASRIAGILDGTGWQPPQITKVG